MVVCKGKHSRQQSTFLKETKAAHYCTNRYKAYCSDRRELQLFHNSKTAWALKLPLTNTAVCAVGEGSYFLLISAKFFKLRYHSKEGKCRGQYI